MEGEEWADGADGFFTEFAANTKSSEKSARKRNREAHEDPHGTKAALAARSDVDRKLSAAEARRRIAAAVVSRASAKELARARQMSRKEQRKSGSARQTPKGSGNEGGSGSGGEKRRTGEDEASTTHFAVKKRSKIDEKFGRKEERKEETRVHAIKYRRSLKKR